MKIVWENDDILQGIMVIEAAKQDSNVFMVMINEAVTTPSKFGLLCLTTGVVTVLGVTATDLAALFNQRHLIPQIATRIVSSELKTIIQQIMGEQ